jgi:hypothetical protein
MIDRILALTAVACVLFVAYFIGVTILWPVKDSIKSRPLFDLSSVIMGIGVIGGLTAITGAMIGYSQNYFYIIYIISIIFFSIYYLIIKRLKFSWQMKIKWDVKSIFILAIMIFHFTCFFLIGFMYAYGSDAFSYILIAQEYLKQGQFVPMILEPLGEINPLFKAPCLFEMVYINLLALSNLIAISLFSKIQFIIAFLIVFFVTREMGGQKASWIAVALLLTEPLIAYFAHESADNYFISVSFEVLCIYYIWNYYKSQNLIFLTYGGIFAGMMISSKLTAIYYAISIILLLPIMLLKKNTLQKDAEGPSLHAANQYGLVKKILSFIIPFIIVGSLFPIIIYAKTSQAVMGLDWLLMGLHNDKPISWIYPFYKIEYNNFLRYRELFIINPDLPYSLAKIINIFSYYIFNPFKLHFDNYMSFIFHTPVSFFVVISPVVLIFIKKIDYFFRWLSYALISGYGLMIFSYPLILPKSELFQLIPTAILVSCALNSLNITTIQKNTSFQLFKKKISFKINKTLGVNLLLILLLSIVFINAYRILPHYYGLIKIYSFSNIETFENTFKQKWFVDNLSEKDTLFGRHSNQICYIEKPKIIPFFWESLYFVPWKIVEKRIDDLKVNVIYDSSKKPTELEDSFKKILPILRKRDPDLASKVEQIIFLYDKNYFLKNMYLSTQFQRVAGDSSGMIFYRIKQ